MRVSGEGAIHASQTEIPHLHHIRSEISIQCIGIGAAVMEGVCFVRNIVLDYNA